jgi:hypothetical protein
MRSGIEEMKNIPICDLFYCVAMDIVWPLPKTIIGNKYVIIAIDHYSKWCEARPVKEHDVCTTIKFLENEVICRYGVFKYILTDIGNEWMKELKCVRIMASHISLPPLPGLNAMVWWSI